MSDSKKQSCPPPKKWNANEHMTTYKQVMISQAALGKGQPALVDANGN